METDLWTEFLTNDDKRATKFAHYFHAYERHFSAFRGRPVVLLEIGVRFGGSLQLWKRYLGPLAQVVGIDIDPECRQHEDEQIQVLIGDQKDPNILQSILDSVGVPDIVLDDGSHVMSDIKGTFDFLYPLMRPGGVYFIEDVGTAYLPGYGGGYLSAGSFIETSKQVVDAMNATVVEYNQTHHRGDERFEQSTTEYSQYVEDIGRGTLGVSFYPGCVVLERGTYPSMQLIRTGKWPVTDRIRGRARRTFGKN